MSDETTELRRLDDWRLRMLEEGVRRIEGKLDKYIGDMAEALDKKADKADLEAVRKLVIQLLVASVLLFASALVAFIYAMAQMFLIR